MILIGYAHNAHASEEINDPLEEFLVSEMAEAGYDFVETTSSQDENGKPLRALEFVFGEQLPVADLNAREKAFLADADGLRAHIEAMVGDIALVFVFLVSERDKPAPALPATVGNGDKKMQFFGWCSGTDSKGKTHDKIWGVISAQGEWITFWGARGKKLSFKRSNEYASGDSLETMIRSKQRKDYRDTTMQEMNALDPEFETRFEENLILCLMADQFHQTPSYA